MSTRKVSNTTRGQALVIVVLSFAIFLIGVVGFATDYTAFWFKRQRVQAAADATCLSGAVDLMLYATGGETPNMNFTPAKGATLDCSTNPTAAPCQIAAINGYNATHSGKHVVMTFPATVSGATAPGGVSVPFIQVDVSHDVPTFFSRILSGNSTVSVHASATCGLASPGGPAPIIVLHPTDPYTIDMTGNKDTITVVGGPQRSIMVNSKNSSAVTSGSLQAVDLHRAGPNRTGGNLATFGGQSTAPASVSLGQTGAWEYPALPITDPYAYYTVPVFNANLLGRVDKALKGSQCNSAKRGCYKYDGCPDPAGCDQYTAGYYPNGIQVKNATATFDPGVYYIAAGNISNVGLELNSNSNVRTSTAAGDGSGGIMFFFSGTSTLYVNANSGKASNGTNQIDVYYRDGGSNNGVASRALKCGPGYGDNPPDIPETIVGNVILGPCTGPYADPSGMYRGFVFFQNRLSAPDPKVGPNWQGGGSTLVSGFMYFHQCGIENPKNAKCSGHGDIVTLGGNPSSTSYVIGSLVTDKIATNGNPGIIMILNPAKSFPELKVAFLK